MLLFVGPLVGYNDIHNDSDSKGCIALQLYRYTAVFFGVVSPLPTVCKEKFEALTKCQGGYLHSYLISRQCLWCIPHQAKPSDSEDESGTQPFRMRTGDHLTGILGRGYTQTLHPELLQLENSAHLPEPCQGCGNHSASACKSSTGWVNKVGVCAQSHWKLDRLVYIIPSDLVI